MSVFLGVDVGTGSARAGLFDAAGDLKGAASEGFATWREGDRAEQSSADIWRAVCAAVRGACAEAGTTDVVGIGFDAACSMAVLDAEDAPVPVGDDPARDVIVWMDQRATDQAARINATGHPVLRYVGGRISPEMQTPKLLWLKENRPETYGRAARFLDLADFLTFRATGDDTRSTCTVTCKWTFLAHEGRWDPSYFETVGLGDLAADGFARIGGRVAVPGTPLGRGLSRKSADELGLAPGTPVGAGLIDAHAGGLGTVGAPGGTPLDRMAYVYGTSACTMSSAAGPVEVPGVWGPYFDAMVPGLWLLEGGQSAAGAAIDRLLALHPARSQGLERAGGTPLPVWLEEEARRRAPDPAATLRLARGLTVVPDFLGNRAPLADPAARAVIAGLGMDDGLDGLLAFYVAGLIGVGYGLRQIVEAQAEAGLPVREAVISGGAGAGPLVRQVTADAANLPILVPSTPEPVLLGAAMLGARAAGRFAALKEAMAEMSGPGSRVSPDPSVQTVHVAGYRRFRALQAAARS